MTKKTGQQQPLRKQD